MKKLIVLFCFLVSFQLSGMQYVDKIFDWVGIKNTYESQSSAQESSKKVVMLLKVNQQNDNGSVASALMDAYLDPSIQGIVLLINSNGGDCADFSFLHDLVKKIALDKPVVVFIQGYACSAGYLVASAANYIISASLAQIGSIGIYIEVLRVTGEGNVKLDDITSPCKVTVISAGRYKSLFNPCSEPLSTQEIAYLQERTQVSYRAFCQLIADNRNLNMQETELWADGQTFLSFGALELGLIDEIGTMLEVRKKMSELLNVTESQISFIFPPSDGTGQ